MGASGVEVLVMLLLAATALAADLRCWAGSVRYGIEYESPAQLAAAEAKLAAAEMRAARPVDQGGYLMVTLNSSIIGAVEPTQMVVIVQDQWTREILRHTPADDYRIPSRSDSL